MAKKQRKATGTPVALIYTRVSTDRQERDGVSLDAQLATCRRYAASHGWVLGNEYQDVMSGSRDDREKYNDMLAEAHSLANQGHAVVVVVAALDRFSRKLLEQVQRRQELAGLGVAVHAIREGGEVNEFMANFLAVIAEDEVKRLGARVSDAIHHIQARGWHYVARAAWGYRLRPTTAQERGEGAPKTTIDIDPDTAPYVREAFRRVAEGETVRSVARWVASLPAEVRGRVKGKHECRMMNLAAVQKMFTAPVYVARQAEGDDDVLARPVCRWPALIDDETWRRVQERVSSHARLPRQASGEYLLTGFLRCPRCNGRMVGKRLTRQQQYRYACTAHVMGAAGSSCQFTCKMSTVDQLVLGDVLGWLHLAANPATAERLKGGINAQPLEALAIASKPDEATTEARLVELQTIAQTARQRIIAAAEKLLDGTITKDVYDAVTTKAKTELDDAEAEIVRLKARKTERGMPDVEAVLANAKKWETTIRQGSTAERRTVLSSLVQHARPARLGINEYDVSLTWTPLGQVMCKLARPDVRERLTATA
ncbi:MAG TPA: recombinase family protein [Chloroflexota bacterium]|nr:recombinase family protein [Chloroflexota bacterium]